MGGIVKSYNTLAVAGFGTEARDFRRAGEGFLTVWTSKIIRLSIVKAPAWWADANEVGTYISSVDNPNVT